MANRGRLERLAVVAPPDHPAHAQRRLTAAVTIVGMLVVLPWWSRWSGDAVIHLVYGLTAAHGDWFVFNPGEHSTGTSSIGWTHLLALLLGTLPLSAALTAIKALSVASVGVVAAATVLALRRSTLAPGLVIFFALAVAVNPGYAYNAALGMENTLFAALAALAALTPLGPIASVRGTTWRAITAGLVVGGLVSLRPEGAIVGGVLLAFAAAHTATGPARRAHLGRWLAMAASAAVVIGAVYGHYWSVVGELGPTASMRSRLLLARLQSLHAGPLWIDPSFSLRLGAYLPVTILAVAGTGSILRSFGPATLRDARRCEALAQAALLWGFWVGYTFVTGAAHVARYTMFLLPLWAVLAAAGLQAVSAALRHRPAVRRSAFAVAVAWLALVYAAETVARVRDPSQGGAGIAQAELLQAPDARRAATDSLLRTLGVDPSATRGVTVAAIEVQLRYFVDDRVRVISADGRILPLGHILPVGPDFRVDDVAFLRQERPDFVVDWIDASWPPPRWRALAAGAGVATTPAGREGIAALLTPGRLPVGAAMRLAPDIWVTRVQGGLRVTYT